MNKRGDEKTVLMVEDHPVFRQGLKSIINGSKGVAYKIVGEVATAEEAFKLAGTCQPDLILIDISLAGPGNGISLTRRVLECYPGTKVIIISMHSKIDYVCESLKAGALGYLTKDSASEELLKAMSKVLRGEEYLAPSLLPVIVNSLKQTRVGGELFSDRSYSLLSDREQEVLRLLAYGDKVVDIGKQLSISPKTVENHRASIFKKLNFTKYFDLYQYARRVGIIDPDF